MVASQGIRSAANPGPGNDLAYIFRTCYADLTHSRTGITDGPAKAARDAVNERYKAKPEFGDELPRWYDFVL